MDVESKPHIFPTQSRTKHSKLVSFPVGAELLSRALDGLPQHAQLTCIFSAGSLQRNLGRELIYLMSVGYTKHARTRFDSGDAAARGIFEPRWEIWVHTVPVAMRADVKKALVETGFPNIIRPWLMANGNITGKTGNFGMIIEYNTIDKMLVPKVQNNLLPDRA
jgi:hypothetical protein